MDKFYEYQMKLSAWRDLRYQRETRQGSRPGLLGEGGMGPSKPIGHIVKEVISQIKTDNDTTPSPMMVDS